MKFVLLLVLSFAAIFGLASASNCTTIQWDPSNQQLVNILNTGFQQAVAEAIQEGKIVNCAWNWTQVMNGETCITGGIPNYNFGVMADNNCYQDDALFNLFINVFNVGEIELFAFDVLPM